MTWPIRLTVWLIAMFPFLWAVGFTRTMGSDMWWHIASGDYMRNHATVVTTDPFSFTFAGQPWIHHEWLGDIFLSFWVEHLTVETLIYWKWGLILAIYSLLFLAAVRLCGGRMFWPAFTTLTAAATACPFLDIRPQLYTFLGYVLVLNLFWIGGWVRWLIVPLVALWVNLHGGFIFALMALGILWLPEFVEEPEKRKTAVGMFLATLLATGINPHGFETTVFPFRYALQGDNPYTTLLEWLPPFQELGFQSRVFPYLMGAFILVTVVWFPFRHRPTDLRLFSALLLGVLTLCMALQSRRFIPLFGLSAVLVLAPALTRATEPVKDKVSFWLAPPLVFLWGLVCVWPFPKNELAFDYMVARDQYPIDVCDFLEQNNIDGKVFNLYNYGGYLHYRGQGRWKVFIDGRADTVYSGEHFLEYQKVQHLKSVAVDIVNASEADLVIWPMRQNELAKALVKSGQWRLVYFDSIAFLLVREDRELGELRQNELSPWRLLAEGQGHILRNEVEPAEAVLKESLRLRPTFRGFEMLHAILVHQKKTAEIAQVRREWQTIFPHGTWFIKIFGP